MPTKNSWGLTQRTIGVMTMVDQGLVLPPKVAGIQVVIIPLGLRPGMPTQDRESLRAKIQEHRSRLQKKGLRVKVDDSMEKSPGWKFNHWEMKGVPLRLELGARDLQSGIFVLAKRTDGPDGSKTQCKDGELEKAVETALEDIHFQLYDGALRERDARLAFVDVWANFSPDEPGKACPGTLLW